MIRGGCAHGKMLTGRQAAAEKDSSLPATGKVNNFLLNFIKLLKSQSAEYACRCNHGSQCCGTFESCVSCCLAPHNNASIIYNKDFRSPGRYA